MHVASFIKRKTCYKVLPAELSNVIDEEGDLHSGRSSLACQGPGTRSSWTQHPSVDHTWSSGALEVTQLGSWGLGLHCVSRALDPGLFTLCVPDPPTDCNTHTHTHARTA